MFLKPASRYRSVRKVERRLNSIASATAAAIARHDERQDAWIALHGEAEALRTRLRAMVPQWERDFRDGRVVGLALGIPMMIVLTMIFLFVAKLRPSWPLLLVELGGVLVASAVHEGQHIRMTLRPIRTELKVLERKVHAAGVPREAPGPVAVSQYGRIRCWR